MKKTALTAILLALTSFAAAAQESGPIFGRTEKEEWQLVSAAAGSTGREVGGAIFDPPELRKTRAIDLIEDTIRRTNAGEPHVRRPVSRRQCLRLQAQLNAMGHPCALEDVQAAVDVGHELLRENPRANLRQKAAEILEGRRPNFFGNVAEVAEGRERKMIQTEDPQSKAFDLMEERAGGKKIQVKMFDDAEIGLDRAVEDVKRAPMKIRYGVMPGEQLDELVEAGRLRRRRINGVTFYETVESPVVRFFPSEKFNNTGEAREYCRKGQELLAGKGVDKLATVEMFSGGVEVAFGLYMLYASAPQFARDLEALQQNGARTDLVLAAGRSGSMTLSAAAFTVGGISQTASRTTQFASAGTKLASLSKWSGKVGLAGVLLAEGIMVVQYCRDDISGREFWTASMGTAAAFGGMFVGGKIGGIAGGAIGFFFGGPPGAVIGQFFGELAGAFLGGWIAEHYASQEVGSYYDLRDERQQRQLEDFMLSHYRSLSAEGR